MIRNLYQGQTQGHNEGCLSTWTPHLEYWWWLFFFPFFFFYILDFFSEAMSLLKSQHWHILSLKLRLDSTLEWRSCPTWIHCPHWPPQDGATSYYEGLGPKLLSAQVSSTPVQPSCSSLPVTGRPRKAGTSLLSAPLGIHGLPLTAWCLLGSL